MPHLVPGTTVSLLTKNRKLNCWSWSIPAGPGVCAGFNLEKGSVCQSCYAAQGTYRFPVVKEAQQARLTWWREEDTQWKLDRMVHAIGQATRGNLYFRVFESGDFTTRDDVENWMDICGRLPLVQFWFSTRAWLEPKLLWNLHLLETLPNVVVRYSGMRVGDHRALTQLLWEQLDEEYFSRELTTNLEGKIFHSSSVTYSDPCPKQIHGSCNAGQCRACWDKSVPHINYQLHGHQVNWRKR